MTRLSSERILRLCYRVNSWPSASESIYFQSGREAFLALLRSVEGQERKVVLLPSYVPEGLFAPAIASGWHVHLYPIQPNLSPDWKILTELLNCYRPKVAVLIHYFGVAQDASRFDELCRGSGTLSVEDNSHLVTLPESNLGTATGVVLTSLPKIFGLPDGACLSLIKSSAKKLLPSFDVQSSNLKYTLSQAGALLMSTLSSKLPVRASIFVSKVSGRLFRPYPILMKCFTTVRPMSRLSLFLIAHTDRREEAERRIKLASVYASLLNRKVFRHFQLSPSTSHGMFGYPVMVTDRQGLVNHLAAYNISGTILSNRWDFRGDAKYTLTDGTERILCEHFLFPLSASLSITEVMRIIDIANKWADLSEILEIHG